jgi:pimeloyl-ACP methyl ester carboxylesterase
MTMFEFLRAVDWKDRLTRSKASQIWIGTWAILRAWLSSDVQRIRRRPLVSLFTVVALVYLAALTTLYYRQRDIVFVRARWWHEDTPPSDFVERTVRESDGTRLRIWESGPAAKGKPTIVFFYGNAGTLSDFAAVGEDLHTLGYGVVLGSYRGYSGNPGDPSEKGLFADARAILGALPHGYGPVVVWGQSLGTGVAARMAAEGRASGLVLQSPYTSLVDIAAMQYPLFPVRLLDRDPFDTFSLVPRIRMPVLIIHGTDDGTVPFWMGERLKGRFGREATLVPIEHGGHNNLSEDELVPPALQWLNANSRAIGTYYRNR